MKSTYVISVFYEGHPGCPRDKKLRDVAGSEDGAGTCLGGDILERDMSFSRKTERGAKSLVKRLKRFRWAKVELVAMAQIDA